MIRHRREIIYSSAEKRNADFAQEQNRHSLRNILLVLNDRGTDVLFGISHRTGLSDDGDFHLSGIGHFGLNLVGNL